jgi:F-type H+-transporting ATPase subunit delta
MKAIRLYAQVLVDVSLAEKSGVDLIKITAELKSFSDSLQGSAIAQKAFESPMLSEEEKQRALAALCEKSGVSPFSSRFLGMLLKRARLKLLPAILLESERLQVEKQGGLIGDLVSAIPLDQPALAGVAEALSKRFQKPVHLNASVDSTVIAGMRVTINGVTYDGTVRSKLAKFASMS